jgi:hypothetical protein
MHPILRFKGLSREFATLVRSRRSDGTFNEAILHENLSEWRADRKPHMPRVRKIGVALRTSAAWLLYGKDDPDDKPLTPEPLQTRRVLSPLRSGQWHTRR